MWVIKKINNNVVLCRDGNNRELIAFGKGLGFPKPPYIITDLSTVERTFYNLDEKYMTFFQDIPEDIFFLTSKIIDLASSHIKKSFNPNLIFTLSDHINFMIERHKKGMYFTFAIIEDFKHLYPKEYKIALSSIKMINKKLNINLPEQEGIGIAMCFINSVSNSNISNKETMKYITDITEIIENFFEIKIDKDSINYSRYVSHMNYLFRRINQKDKNISENAKLYTQVKEIYPQINDCVDIIKNYIEKTMSTELGDEELLYLIIHVNKLYFRGDCYQSGITPNTDR